MTKARRIGLIRWIVLSLVFANTPAHAFSSGSNESDGALNLNTPGVIEFDPVALGIDRDGDHIFHFTSITVGTGVTVRLTARKINGPVVWLASGDIRIDGIVDLSGEKGQNAIEYINCGSRSPSIPGSGGFPGGVGRCESNVPQSGAGPGGGRVTFGARALQGAGHATEANFGVPGASKAYGNSFIVPLLGGSGGAGGDTYAPSGGGGAGGGAILAASSTRIVINGQIKADGGNGGVVWGGSGSGGAIRLVSNDIEGAGTLNAGGGDSYGSAGRIRLEASRFAFTAAPAQPPQKPHPMASFFRPSTRKSA